MAISDISVIDPRLQRWRTAFWSAVVATPLVAGMLGALVNELGDGQPHRGAKVGGVIGTVVVANIIVWRWPRVSGAALGVAALFPAAILFWGIAFVVGGVLR